MKKGQSVSAGRNEYLCILLKSYRSEIRADMERLRDLRRQRGEILFINQLLDDEMSGVRQRITGGWENYRRIMGFDIGLSGQDRRVSTPDSCAGITKNRLGELL